MSAICLVVRTDSDLPVRALKDCWGVAGIDSTLKNWNLVLVRCLQWTRTDTLTEEVAVNVVMCFAFSLDFAVSEMSSEGDSVLEGGSFPISDHSLESSYSHAEVCLLGDSKSQQMHKNKYRYFCPADSTSC